MGSTFEVFPVSIKLNGCEVWLGWISAEPWDYFARNGKSVVWSFTCSGLLDGLSKTGGCFIEKHASYFDLDSAVASIKKGVVIDATLLLNLWNIFTDFYNTIHVERVRLFCIENIDAYDCLFSSSDAAIITNIKSKSFDKSYVGDMLMTMEAGRDLIFNNTVNSE